MDPKGVIVDPIVLRITGTGCQMISKVDIVWIYSGYVRGIERFC